MGPVWMQVEKWRKKLLSLAERGAQSVKPLLPRLPGLVSWMLLALGAGWVGGRWAAQPIVSEQTASVSPNLSPRYEEEAASASQEMSASKPSDAEGKPYLGIRGKEIHQGKLQGVKILEVFPGTPAARAGLRAESDLAPASVPHSTENSGHVIIGVNRQIIRSEDDLGTLLARSPPGSVIQLLVVSTDGNSYDNIPVTVGVAPRTSFTAAEAHDRRAASRQDTDQNMDQDTDNDRTEN